MSIYSTFLRNKKIEQLILFKCLWLIWNYITVKKLSLHCLKKWDSLTLGNPLEYTFHQSSLAHSYSTTYLTTV